MGDAVVLAPAEEPEASGSVSGYASRRRSCVRARASRATRSSRRCKSLLHLSVVCPNSFSGGSSASLLPSTVLSRSASF